MACIDREKTIEAIRKYADIKHSNDEPIEYVNGILKSISVINEQRTADVVKVVRCKDCKYRRTLKCPMYSIDRMAFDICKPNSFCSYGERE